MNVEQLYSIITDAQYYAAGILTLPAGVFGPGDVQTLVSTWIGPRLVIDQVESIRTVGNTVVLDGTMTLLGVENQPVLGVTFALVDLNGVETADGAPALFIDFPLPVQEPERTPWTFADSFPVLKGTDLEPLTFLGTAFFLLSSVPRAATQQLPQVPSGLAFYAPQLVLTVEPIATIGSLLGQKPTLPMFGPITVLSGSVLEMATLQPGIQIQSTLAEFGQLNTSFFIEAVSERRLEQGVTYYRALRLAAQVTIGSAPPIKLSAEIGNLGKTLVLEADVAKATSYALNILSSWLGGAALGGELNGSGFNLGDYVTLRRLRFHFATRMLASDPLKALSAVSLTIGTPVDTSWDVVKGYFTINGIAVTFMVNNPLGGSGGQKITTVIEGEATFVEEIALAAWGSFPDASFGLSATRPIRFAQIFKRLNIPAVGFPDLVCRNLYIEATPPSGPYSVAAEVTSDWRLDLGVRDLEMSQASVSLGYQEGSISGNVFAMARLMPKEGGDDLNVPIFLVNWQIPGPFMLSGTFPDINLTDLARTIAGVGGLALPSGFPDIALKNSTISLTVTPGQSGNQPEGTTYDFMLRTTVTVGGTSGLTLIGQLLKTPKETGFVAGIWTENWSWSPAQLPGWENTFGTILSGIEFKRSGLIVSSLQQTSLTFDGAPTDLPQQIKRGLTFFTEIGFGNSPLKVLENFFGPGSANIKLYALIADPLSNSMFIAKIGDSSTTQRYAFTGLQISVTPATQTFSVQAGVSFTFTDLNGKDVILTFIGGGSISLTGMFTIYFVLKGDSIDEDTQSRTLATTTVTGPPKVSPGWKEPFGIPGLTIHNFWGEIGVGSEGFTLGFGGQIQIEQVMLELAIVGGVIGEVPYVDVFKFSIAVDSPANAITLTSIVRQFTSLDPSWVQLLDSVSFRNFMVAIVLSPSGWTNPATQEIYLPGFYTSGDVTLFGFTIVFDVKVYFTRGIVASGYVDKALVLADGLFKLTDASGTKGPFGSIDTLALTQLDPTKEYIRLSGSLVLLDLSATIDATVKLGGWAFSWKATNFIFENEVTCYLKNGAFSASVSGKLGLDIATTSGVVVGGMEIIPPISLSIHLAAGISIAINPGFSFRVSGSFTFGSQTLTIDVGLSITSWNDLSNLLESVLGVNPSKLFADLVSDARKWATAIGDGVVRFVGDVAKALKDAFGVASDAAAEILRLAGYTMEQAIAALESVWNLAASEAERLANEAWKVISGCATTTATFFM